MRAWSLAAGLLALGLFVGLSSCGGNSSLAHPPERGEGNIPIGRMPNREEAAVSIMDVNGRRWSGHASQGIIYSPPLPAGLATVVITPNDRQLQPVTVTFLAGPNQRFQMTVRPMALSGRYNLGDVKLNIQDGSVFRVGEIVDLKMSWIGNVRTDRGPTVWLNGGVAALDTQDRVVMLEPGSGAIVVEYRGQRKTFRFSVQ